MAGTIINDQYINFADKIYDMALIGSALTLLPILVAIGTSFAKISIVLSLIRNALGVQQIPPNMTLYGIALILTLYIMKPVVSDMYELYNQYSLSEQTQTDPSSDKVKKLSRAAEVIAKPLIVFLQKNTRDTELNFFLSSAKNIWPEKYHKDISKNDLLILLPAFSVSEITRAFEIGFLIYLPFIVIDLVVSNILLTLGMMMVSPMTISLPFKLLLFVMVDGWSRLMHGLVLTYK